MDYLRDLAFYAFLIGWYQPPGLLLNCLELLFVSFRPLFTLPIEVLHYLQHFYFLQFS